MFDGFSIRHVDHMRVCASFEIRVFVFTIQVCVDDDINLFCERLILLFADLKSLCKNLISRIRR